jgi:hypothetical protein
LLRALLLQVLYTIRSERLLMEQLDYNLLCRWFVGLKMDDAVWDSLVCWLSSETWLIRTCDDDVVVDRDELHTWAPAAPSNACGISGSQWWPDLVVLVDTPHKPRHPMQHPLAE